MHGIIGMQLLLLQLLLEFLALQEKMSLQMIGQHSLLQDLSCLMLILFLDAGEIMDEHVHDDLIEKIRATSNQVEGIIDTENASSVKRNEISCGLACDRNAMITERHDLAH
jgi:hypothetical protein